MLLSLLLLLLFIFFKQLERIYFVERAKSLDGIKSIRNYYNYEGHRNMTLILENGGEFVLFDFGADIFNKTERLVLTSFEKTEIQCLNKDNSNNVLNGFNLIDFLKAFGDGLKVNNLKELVANYPKVTDLIVGRLGEEFKEFHFSSPKSQSESLELMCKLKPIP